MKITQKKKKIPKKVILTAIALLIIGGAGAFGLYQSQQATHRSSSGEIRPVNDVDYSPPTPQEEEQKDDTKEEIIKKKRAGNHSAAR